MESCALESSSEAGVVLMSITESSLFMASGAGGVSADAATPVNILVTNSRVPNTFWEKPICPMPVD